jgi:hypothetical protein
MRNIVPIIAIGMLAVSATSAQAVQAVNLIKNGSFETLDPALSFDGAGVLQVTGATTTALSGWVGLVNRQFKINNAHDAQAGLNSLDLSGNGGYIHQNVTGLTVGTKYRVSFSLSGNPAATTDPRFRLSVTSPTGFKDFTFDSPAGQSANNMGWTRVSYDFVAGATTTRVALANNMGAATRDRGVVIDNMFMSVAVPEPATWAMLLTGFGMVGFAARRRRTVVAA